MNCVNGIYTGSNTYTTKTNQCFHYVTFNNRKYMKLCKRIQSYANIVISYCKNRKVPPLHQPKIYNRFIFKNQKTVYHMITNF